MPQDSLRSIVYRSFVTCDDPKGVVECRRIRRSEAGSETTMERKNRSNVKDQLLEVSRRAHELNHVTDSFSKGLWCDGNSKDAAKDLFKGALDLQNSLHVLGRLQEASHYMAKLRKKEKEKWDGMRLRNEQVIRREDSSPVGERSYCKESRNLHLSADGFSRDCIEELREVIRDSLARQNLLPNINVEEKRCFGGRFDSASDIRSTSSSRSSTLRTDNFTSMDSSISLSAQEKKGRGPSLVAKLMGLEELPSKPLRTNSQEVLESKKIFVRPKHIFEISRPKVRKSEYVFREKVRESRTMKDILEIMHFKGLLKSNFIKEINNDSHQWSDFVSEQKLINNFPPIVLIKPRLNPCLQPQDKSVPLFKEKESLKTETMLEKEPPSTRRLSSNQEAPIKRLSSREGFKENKEKEALKKHPTKMKTSGSRTMPLLKKEATHKKIKRIPKPVISRTKPVNKEVAKAKNSSRSKDETKVNPPKSCKLENGSNITKYKMPNQRIYTANSNSSLRPKTIARATKDRRRIPTREEKPVSKATTTAKLTTEKLEYEGDDILWDGKNIDVVSENSTVSEEKMVALTLEEDSNETADRLPTKEETEHTDVLSREQHDNSDSSVCDVSLVTTDDQKNQNSIGDIDDDPIIPIGTDGESFMRGTRLKALLLSNPAFLNHVEEHFYLHVNLLIPSQELGVNDFTDGNAQLSLDCVNEIIRQRSFPKSQMLPSPLLSMVGNVKSHISLDHLLKEICDGIESLRSYSELASENYPTGSLYSMLERDLKLKEVSSGIWDLGWRNGFSVNETMQVVVDIEKQLLTGLIEEICA
ncbi:uncharacterized protein LOC120114850 isoform X2 [Hibiscus syriacus]|uniref:uncharacterized protein LOC120114850 isoform X2 n=1 Tax=Hibiscus syriacus TaxID=106335 RepID=UPI001920C00B|nr:uncharacterized protein LOC120114850 isoform X2 [Hibiscus syriacus]